MKSLAYVLAAGWLLAPLAAQAEPHLNPYIPAVPCEKHCRVLECPGVYYQTEIQLSSAILDRLWLAETLSPAARNLRLCTTWNTVTVKGHVASPAEKAWILRMCRHEASPTFRVIDELVVGP